MSRARQDILLEAAGMEPGERIRIVCPVCGGGSTKERCLSLAIADDGTPMWNCFRASCDEAGSSRSQRAVRVRAERARRGRQNRARPYDGPLEYLTPEQEEFLKEKIGWGELHLALGRPLWAPEKERYAFPIFGPMGVRRGYVLRSYTGEEPKALTRMDVAEDHLSWYRNAGKDRVLVVEDIPSAVRAAMYVPTVALCGTGVSFDIAHEIASHARNVVWALDADATKLALQYKNRFDLLFDESGVVVLETDLKDLEEDDLQEKLKPYAIHTPTP